MDDYSYPLRFDPEMNDALFETVFYHIGNQEFALDLSDFYTRQFDQVDFMPGLKIFIGDTLISELFHEE